ncbi:hypothetical protein LCGC14_1286940, partial [marine sediment metagenome]
YWMFGSQYVSGWCGFFLAGKAAPAGRILVFDEEKVYGFGRKPKYFSWTTPIEHHLFAADKMPPASSEVVTPAVVRTDSSPVAELTNKRRTFAPGLAGAAISPKSE